MGEFSAQLSCEAMDREEESFGKISDPEPAWWTMLLRKSRKFFGSTENFGPRF